MKVRVRRPLGFAFSSLIAAISCSLFLLVAGCGSVHPGTGGGGGSSSSPTVTMTASPTSIAAGASSTLTVTATNATTVVVTGSDGSSYNMAAASGGTQVVKPAATTTYTAKATGASGTTPATATATVTVAPPNTNPTVTVTANPASIAAGSASTLMIATTNTTTVTVAGTDGSSYTVQLTNGNGTQAVSPLATTTYTVTATGAAGTTPATATATVTVTGAPPPPPAPTVTINANPTTINAGGTSTLTVTATNATNLVIQGSDGTSFSSPALPVGGGTETVTPATTTTYTATATNATGTVTATVVVTVVPALAVTITASPASIAVGNSSTLTVTATSATSVTITGTDKSSYTLPAAGGTQSVSPTSTTTYTATADGVGGSAPVTATATVTVVPPGTVKSINHVIFMLQENHTFDDYFGMLNPYRQNNGYDKGDDGNTYDVDGLVNGSEDKRNGQTYDAVRGSTIISNKDKSGGVHTLYPLKSTCLDDMSSAWSESFGAVSLGNYLTTRPIRMQGFADNGNGFAVSKCPAGSPGCVGFTDTTGDRTMGFYDQTFLNYYYYMASQFALSDRWFSPIESKSIPNRIATFTGGTTQGLTKDPSQDDKLGALTINNIFQELDAAGVSWKVYYTVTNAECDPEDCKPGSSLLPSTTFSYLTYSFKYVGGKPSDPGGCVAPKQPDSSNSFCIDPTHMASLNDPTNGYFADLKNGKLPSFSFIESGSGLNDEHPGYQQSVLAGQYQVSTLINALMNTNNATDPALNYWKDSVFFLAYDEGGGPYDHVPPVPGHTNDFTDTVDAPNYPTDVTKISVQPDSFYPCVPTAAGDFHCDLSAGQPGSNAGDAAGPPPDFGFGAQVGFRVPDMVVSPFARRHYVSHIPMDHTAVIRFVEDRFIGNGKYLTARDAAQPNLLDFFDFTGVPWATPPTPPAAVTKASFSTNTCQPTNFH